MSDHVEPKFPCADKNGVALCVGANGPRCVPAYRQRTYEQGVEEGERRATAAVVAWLRQRRYPDAFIHAPWVADAIERGEHRRKEER